MSLSLYVSINLRRLTPACIMPLALMPAFIMVASSKNKKSPPGSDFLDRPQERSEMNPTHHLLQRYSFR
ncbi:MAG: hypothetical protein PSV26_01215 [Polaromonas sp.]|uniref:hypothetical protein n=1 Tax=Polaromonas sp. TaxID=1869339 RepID=UPI00248917DB|nr:hypothetical protein [Polaromonas sp.]MDI1236084.1 hypothetical protein [Polaromonas sp.]